MNTNNLFNELMESFSNDVLTSNSGSRKESIYKTEIFKDCVTDRDKKTRRRQLRNVIDSVLSSFLTYEKQANKDNLKKLASQFEVFYKKTYSINDYSVASISSKNTEINKKEGLIKMMNAFKELNAKKENDTKTSKK